ncbi:hypothetical protein PG984_001383 [Apiospora sp. TS-2023a]
MHFKLCILSSIIGLAAIGVLGGAALERRQGITGVCAERSNTCFGDDGPLGTCTSGKCESDNQPCYYSTVCSPPAGACNVLVEC